MHNYKHINSNKYTYNTSPLYPCLVHPISICSIFVLSGSLDAFPFRVMPTLVRIRHCSFLRCRRAFPGEVDGASSRAAVLPWVCAELESGQFVFARWSMIVALSFFFNPWVRRKSLQILLAYAISKSQLQGLSHRTIAPVRRNSPSEQNCRLGELLSLVRLDTWILLQSTRPKSPGRLSYRNGFVRGWRRSGSRRCALTFSATVKLPIN